MQNQMTPQIVDFLWWILYFVTDIYGHAGFKIATRTEGSSITAILFSFWGLTSGLAWLASSLLWIGILSRSSLFAASSVGSLTYLLMVLTAVLLFREDVSAKTAIGALFIVVGIYFVTR